MGDTPNEKMSRVRNLIRFPATGRDRRIRLEESRDPRIRFVTKLRFVCGWLLAVGAFCFVLTHSSDWCSPFPPGPKQTDGIPPMVDQ